MPASFFSPIGSNLVGAPSGVAALDGSGTVPDSQVNASIARDAEVTAAVSAHAALVNVHGISGALVGTQADGSLWLGSGPPSTTGMVVKSNTNGEAGTWATHTTEAASESGSTFAGFPGTAAENILYVGGSAFPKALRSNTTVAIALGAGAITCEYWNGAAWTTLPFMATGPGATYTNRSNAAFSAVAIDHIRFNEITSTSKTLDGETKHWVRFRITTAITTVPTLESIALIGDAVKVNTDGVIEYFGITRPEEALLDSAQENDGGQGAVPGNTAVSYASGTTKNIQAVGNKNNWTNGAVNFIVSQPVLKTFLDTSLPVSFRVGWYADTVTTGNVEWEVNYRGQKAGDILDGTASSTWTNAIVTVPGTAKQVTVTQFDLNVSVGGPFTSVPLNLVRDALAGNGDDTAAGAIHTTNTRAYARRWRS